MPGSPKKPTALRQGHGAATRDVSLRDDQPPMPLPPKGLLAQTRKLWRDYWGSEVARAVDRAADRHILERWIRAIDEYERVLPEFRKERVSTGSTGQLVIHPLAGYLAQLKTEIKNCEAELGLTPMARTRLGIALGEQKLTAIELNRRLNQAPKGEAIEGEARVIDAQDDEWEDA